MDPGVALETGRSSWSAPLDAVRLAPSMDATTVTAAQVREMVNRLTIAGHWQPGDPDILLVADAGYDGPRLAHVLADLPITVLVRMHSDQVLRRPTPPQLPGTLGRPHRHGGEFAFGDPATWGEPDITTHYNQHRTHRSLAAAAPLRARPQPLDPDQIERLTVRRRDRLGGVIHEYQHAA